MKAAFTETGLTLFLAAAGDHDQGDGEAEGASGEQQQQAFAALGLLELGVGFLDLRVHGLIGLFLRGDRSGDTQTQSQNQGSKEKAHAEGAFRADTKRAPMGSPFLNWCRGEDLNLHGVAPTST